MPSHPQSRDVVDRISRFNLGRNPQRLARKFAAMRTDAFVFFRGTAHLFWEDWPAGEAVDDAPPAWACGDLHLENFGSYRGDNRLVYFDLNDFDEAALAPATRDVTRFLTSIHLAAQSLSLDGNAARSLCETFVGAYAALLADGKARWVERTTSQGMVRDLLRAAKRRRRQELVAKRTSVKGERRRIVIDDVHTFSLTALERQGVTNCVHEFAVSQSRRDADFYRVLDVAGRVAGTGSLGVRRYVALIRGRGGIAGNYLVDLKEARPSSLAAAVAVAQPKWRSEADRVVQIQHRMQAASPALLAPVSLDRGHFVLRELQPTADRVALEHWNGKLGRLRKVLATMGHVVASAQLRSASRQGAAGVDELIAFGRRTDWRREVARYARAYAETATRDWTEFVRGARAPTA